MTMSDSEPLKDLDQLIEKGNLQIERSKKITLKDRYMELVHHMSKDPVRVMVPSIKKDQDEIKGRITEVPKIAESYVDEVEISQILEPYTYVRIKFDNVASEYLYEVIEPSLTEDESILLEMLKNSVVLTINQAEGKMDREKESILRSVTDDLLRTIGINLTMESRERIHYYLRRDFIGYGAIDVMMIDPNVEDCSCDGVRIPLYIFHRKYGSIKSNVRFETDEELDSFVIWLAQRCGKHISVAEPLLDATIPDGSRLNATLGKHVTKRGSSFTIRRFKDNPFTPVDLLRFKTMSTEMMAYLWISTEFGNSMLVCGGTASGKTTTLNAVLLFIPPQMKIISIEDTRELNLPHENWIPGLTRNPSGDGRTPPPVRWTCTIC